ncbi:hypothetical protein GCM10023082_33160 [Streptomyces tremellae]|uniref:Uncharacterized protein n=1 Tax=Streptomyces tremellae TaxID=1124239 RepID=A0ABP7F7U6_9ACTN
MRPQAERQVQPGLPGADDQYLPHLLLPHVRPSEGGGPYGTGAGALPGAPARRPRRTVRRPAHRTAKRHGRDTDWA